jgi:3-isopropylmalate dehydratase small subunit
MVLRIHFQSQNLEGRHARHRSVPCATEHDGDVGLFPLATDSAGPDRSIDDTAINRPETTSPRRSGPQATHQSLWDPSEERTSVHDELDRLFASPIVGKEDHFGVNRSHAARHHHINTIDSGPYKHVALITYIGRNCFWKAVQTRFKGRVWTFGDDISTDHIIAGKYLGTTDSKVFAEHAFEAVDPTWAKKVQPGDLIVAGDNFGCGSSREQAPVALKTLGISAILANSFARIFFRNAINLGFPVLECPGLRRKINAGDVIEVDMSKGEVHLPGGVLTRFTALPPNVLEILDAGGLVPKLKRERSTARGE